ncbi:Delta(12) fatty acid desaturase [Purpureocillium lavendulum]|uniref:Delta(12) fatty acid desaturase n=1 Tax=Purpureocillium lavendulum TaxID=1247861 RepID=A0AB34G122_9HYPO|nr:Delta(12) fatty acid desaturase [Purpureocillium lavendulum]
MSPTKSNRLALQGVVNKLSLADGMTLRDAFSYSSILEQCYSTRVDPVAYLSQAFKHPVTLLSAMFDTGCILIGSRALQFFVPGSNHDESAWTFFVPGYKESVADMIIALNMCGVTWQLEADDTITAPRQNNGTRPHHTVLNGVDSGMDDNDTQTRIQEYNLFAGPILDSLVGAGENGKNLSTSEPTGGHGLSIMNGRLHLSKGAQEVQLIIGNSRDGMRGGMGLLKQACASHVQCFISGWCAAHMYYGKASAKTSTIWRPQAQESSAQQLNTRKYEHRGFRLERASRGPPITRSFNDDESILLDFGDMYRGYLQKSHQALLGAWLAERRENIASITWTEFDGRVFSISDPFEARYQGCEATFTTHARVIAQFIFLQDCVHTLKLDNARLRHEKEQDKAAIQKLVKTEHALRHLGKDPNNYQRSGSVLQEGQADGRQKKVGPKRARGAEDEGSAVIRAGMQALRLQPTRLLLATMVSLRKLIKDCRRSKYRHEEDEKDAMRHRLVYHYEYPDTAQSAIFSSYCPMMPCSALHSLRRREKEVTDWLITHFVDQFGSGKKVDLLSRSDPRLLLCIHQIFAAELRLLEVYFTVSFAWSGFERQIPDNSYTPFAYTRPGLAQYYRQESLFHIGGQNCATVAILFNTEDL